MKYDYIIRTSKIVPPLGENCFAANIDIYEIGVGKIRHDLQEVWGRTRDEAHTKALDKVKGWLLLKNDKRKRI